MPEYFDYNATTPVDPEVAEIVRYYMVEEFGNAGSRTHEFGTRAAKAVRKARQQVASVLATDPDDIIFTSGATESNNLSILGLEKALREKGHTHIITSLAEHKAVLEPFEELERRGFDVTWVRPNVDGFVPPETLESALQTDTGLVSLMHVNNETGIIQPLEEYAEVLKDHSAYWHVDAAQGFGKDIDRLQNKRIDLVSVSGHKIFAPKGIGALMVRYRPMVGRVSLAPLMFGGGQERGLRPGTLPVALIAGLGQASANRLDRNEDDRRMYAEQHAAVLHALERIGAVINGDPNRSLKNAVNFSLPGSDSESILLLLRDEVAASNGSACTSAEYSHSHVLRAMGLAVDRIESAVRLSWRPVGAKRIEAWVPALRSLSALLLE